MNQLERDVLSASYSYWCGQSLPEDQRSVCYSWVVKVYRSRFGADFHQSVLANLASKGWLACGDSAKGGGRRYYTIPDPARVERELGLSLQAL